MTYAIEMYDIDKFYPGVIANDKVNLIVESGEIHGLIGENGAGKSTIMNILYGLTKPDGGTVKLFGEEVEINSPSEAMKYGIGMVHQHFMLMPNLTVFENIILGKVPKTNFTINRKEAINKITSIMDMYDLHVDLNATVEQISVGEAQRVEIIKALYREAKILILDEPTAVLTPSETDKLLEILRTIKKQGYTIIFITHKLREIFEITDNITVMRRGLVTGAVQTNKTTSEELSQLMVGRNVDLNIPMEEFTPKDEILSLENVSALNNRGQEALKNISFSVRGGEIVGVAGVDGNGQTELMEVIAGMLPLTSGELKLNNDVITGKTIRKRRELGISHIHEDRLKVGAAAGKSIFDNIILNRYYQKPYNNNGILNQSKLVELSETLCEDYLVKVPTPEYGMGTLSGGNMQKVILAREMEVKPSLLLASQPTRGVDIGAIEYLHKKIVELRDSGSAVLLVSAELDEIMNLSDRILVMYEGEIVAEFDRGEVDSYEIGSYMLGAKRQVESVNG